MIQTTNGSFTSGFLNVGSISGVAGDRLTGIGSLFAGYTPGLSRFSIPDLQPTVTERWKILGFSAHLLAAVVANNTGGGYMFARFGAVYMGMFFVSTGQDRGATAPAPPTFPPDMSSYTQILSGDDVSALRMIRGSAVNPFDSQFSQVAPPTFILPAPQDMRSGGQITMGLTLTPSLVEGGASVGALQGLAPLLVIRAASYSILYDDGH